MISVTRGDHTAVVILAAGASRRLGSPKQLYHWRGTPLLRRAADTALAAAIGPVVVVLGAVIGPCETLLAGLPLSTCVNGKWAEGLASSIRAGVHWVARNAADATALLLMTCDQPLVPAAHLVALADAVHAGADVAGSAYAGQVGVPAAFAPHTWPELLELTGDAGARAVLTARSGGSLAVLPCDDAATDYDTNGP